MRAEALDGERAGDADGLRIGVRPVVEVLELRLGGDRGVDRLLPGDARLPEVGERLLRGLRPVGRRLARDLPLDERRRRDDLAARHREVASAGASKRTSLPSRPPVVTRNGVLWPRSAAFSAVERRLHLRLVLVADDVDLRVVGDRLQRDVRHALVDEAVADVAVCRLVGERAAADLGLLAKPSGESASR